MKHFKIFLTYSFNYFLTLNNSCYAEQIKENFLDSICCDSTIIYSLTGSTQNDTCYGQVYFKIPTDSNCNVLEIIVN